MVAWQRARMQISPSRTNYVETFKDMQKNSEPLKNVDSCILIGAPPEKKVSVLKRICDAGAGYVRVYREGRWKAKGTYDNI